MATTSSRASPAWKVQEPLNKVALITGASRGIGRAIALRLAADGFNIAINDVSQQRQDGEDVVREVEKLPGRKAAFFAADVTDVEQVKQLIQDVVSKLGALDISVQNAGIVQVKSYLDSSYDDRKKMLDVNCHGVMNVAIEAARQMIKQGVRDYRIINAASIVAFKPYPDTGYYGGSKALVRNFTQGAAQEWAKHGIRVTAYAPGIIRTPMWDQIDNEFEASGISKEVNISKQIVESTSCLKRVGLPEDIAKVVSFLASEDAEYVTGSTQTCDGGISLH